MCLETSGGGSGRHVLDLAGGLLQLGHEVAIVYSPLRAEPEFVSTLSNLSGCKAIPCNMHRSVGIHDIESRKELAALIRVHGPFDILHAHSSKAGALVRLLPGSIPGARIYTPHAFRTMDPDISALSKLAYSNAERLLALATDALIAVSADEASHARSLGISDRKIETIINGVDQVETETREGVRQRLGIPQSAWVAGFVGRFSPQKDPLRFVRAVNLARRHLPQLIGLMVGDGELKAAAEAAAEQDAIVFTGWTNARKLMPAMDVLVMTSRYEAMPYTLLEALSASLPLISTEVGGVLETIRDGENGRILSHDVGAEAIADALADAFHYPQRLTQWSHASRERAKSYTIQEMVSHTVGVYLQARKIQRSVANNNCN
ncbi:glycosyltransferase [Glycocaulis sp.]|uniref:glycosyltransferase n=1 Tax=Glycocaulis sp. TaxID=1969725 RepID=UPI003F6FBEB9